MKQYLLITHIISEYVSNLLVSIDFGIDIYNYKNVTSAACNNSCGN